MIVTGGRSKPTSQNILDTVYSYDPATDEWTELPSLPVPMRAHAATVINDVFIVGNGAQVNVGLPKKEYFTATWGDPTGGGGGSLLAAQAVVFNQSNSPHGVLEFSDGEATESEGRFISGSVEPSGSVEQAGVASHRCRFRYPTSKRVLLCRTVG